MVTHKEAAERRRGQVSAGEGMASCSMKVFQCVGDAEKRKPIV